MGNKDPLPSRSALIASTKLRIAADVIFDVYRSFIEHGCEDKALLRALRLSTCQAQAVARSLETNEPVGEIG